MSLPNSMITAILTSKRKHIMKIVIIHPPKMIAPILAKIFGIKIKKQ